MARYSAFLGHKVELQYRAGDICLPATGTFVADSGRSIFLEQRFDHLGTQKTFRWEVPYQYIVRIERRPPESASLSDPVLQTSTAEPAPDAFEPAQETVEPKASAAAAGASSSTLTLSHTKLA